MGEKYEYKESNKWLDPNKKTIKKSLKLFM